MCSPAMDAINSRDPKSFVLEVDRGDGSIVALGIIGKTPLFSLQRNRFRLLVSKRGRETKGRFFPQLHFISQNSHSLRNIFSFMSRGRCEYNQKCINEC